MRISTEDYDIILFLTRLSYYDIPYPEVFKCVAQYEVLSGLRLTMFDMDEYLLFIFCGTNSFRDWIANIEVGVGLRPVQYEQARRFVLGKAYPHGKPIVIAGHSLGGGIATYVTCQLNSIFNIQCITFNACGCKHLIPDSMANNDITNIVTKHDILTGITRRLPFKKYLQLIGETIIVDDKTFLPLSVKSHCDFISLSKIDKEHFQ